MKKLTKWLALLLAVLLLMGASACGSETAQTGTEETGAQTDVQAEEAAPAEPDPELKNYEFSNGVITAYIGPGGDVTVPAAIDGQAITAIGDRAFAENESITAVTISPGITAIGNEAFSKCVNLTTLDLGTVETIGDNAFYHNDSLTALALPESVKSVGKEAFKICQSMTSLDLGKVETVGESAFEADAWVKDLVLPETLSQIGRRAFALFANSAGAPGPDNGTLVIPAGLASLPDEAFCGSLFTNIQFESDTFPEMTATTLQTTGSPNWILPDSVQPEDIDGIKKQLEAGGAYIPYNAMFMHADGEEIKIVYEDFSDRFEYSTATGSVTKYIGQDAEVRIPESIEGQPITEVGSWAFYNNETVTSVVIPGTVEVISTDAFRGCVNLKTVVIEEGVKTIQSGAFNECVSLESITIPSTVTETESGILYGCTALKEITWNAPKLSNGDVNGCENLERLILGPDCKTVEDGACLRLTSLKELDLGQVESLGKQAFSWCTSLETVTIPGTVKVIGDNAFECCAALREVRIESGVEEIGAYAFADCGHALEFEKAEYILFYNDEDTARYADALAPENPALPVFINFYLPGTLRTIGERAFARCYIDGIYMTDVTSPDQMPELHADAFSSIYYLGQVYFDEATADFTALDAFFGANTPLGDPCWYFDDCHPYWATYDPKA